MISINDRRERSLNFKSFFSCRLRPRKNKQETEQQPPPKASGKKKTDDKTSAAAVGEEKEKQPKASAILPLKDDKVSILKAGHV